MKLALAVHTITRFSRARFVDQRPFILTHLVTARCNGSCEMCLWKDSASLEMRLKEIGVLYEDARHAGFLFLAIWGGEPLLRKDLGDILRVGKDLGFHITLFTNGSLLDSRAREMGALVDRLVVSLDFPDDRHDGVRGIPRLFEKVVSGIGSWRRFSGAPVNINYILTCENYDCVGSMARFARENGVFVTFGGMIRSSDNRRLSLDEERARIVADKIRRLKRQGLPILNSDASLWALGGVRSRFCAYTRIALTVGADGRLNPSCVPAHGYEHWLENYGSLASYLESSDFRGFQESVRRCTFCKDCLIFQEANDIWRFCPSAWASSLIGQV